MGKTRFLLSQKDQAEQADLNNVSVGSPLPRLSISVSTLIHSAFQDKALLSL